MEQLLAVAADVHSDGLSARLGPLHQGQTELQRVVVGERAELEVVFLAQQFLQQLLMVVHA